MTMKPAAALAMLMVASGLGLMTGCATPKGQLVLAAVGPQNPRGSSSGGLGQLQVFTQTVNNNDGGVIYPIHTAYWIYTTNNVRVKSVLNHAGPNDTVPMVVVLPTGTYHVIARADRFGIITVPTVIEGNRITQIYLDSTGLPSYLRGDLTKLVCLPGGPPVGFSAHPPPASAPSKKR